VGDVTKISWGELQRWRAAPAEGMHSDEVSDERSSPRFELGPTPRVAAVFLLISHLAAPLFPRFEASMMNASTKQFACSTVKLQEMRRSFINKKSDPWSNAAATEARSSYDCSRGGYLLSGYNEGFRRNTSKRKDWSLTAALLRQIVPLTDGNQNSNC
jgi:hypothetical protein